MYHSYFYTGVVSLEKVKRNICAMLLAAGELQIIDLIDYLQQELITSHESYVMDHLVELFRTSSSLKSCQKLHQHCEHAIAAKPELLFNAQDFTKLEHDPLKS